MGLAVLPDNTAEALLRVRGGKQAFATDEAWVRPGDWLSLPVVQPSDNKFVGLLAITDDDTNFLALSAAGNYTVDWGDGNTENVSSGVQANHQYTYSAISSATASSRGYRQVLVTVTPQAGQTFTSINIRLLHNQTGLNAYEVKWLDVAIAGSSLTSITIGGADTVATNLLEQAAILSSAVTTWASQFLNCRALQSVSFASSGTVTSTASMFSGCRSLQAVPLFDTAAVTNMSNMFSNCSALRTVPLFDTASVTNMSSMLSGCSSLQTVPLFNTAAVTNMSSMFNVCVSLQTVPLFDTAAVTSMSSMFANCSALRTVPPFNTAAVTTTQSMFSADTSLQSVPSFDLSSINTSASGMFSNCFSLARSSVTGMRFTHSYFGCSLSTAALETIMDNLGKASSGTITVSSNWGSQGGASLSGTTTDGSTTVTMASTTGLSTGMEISGTGISTNAAVTLQGGGTDTVTRKGHGLANGTRVSFSVLNGATGVSTYTPYYVVNTATDTFKVSDTAGGSAKALTATASSFTSLTSGSSSTDATTYATASVTLVTGRLYLLSVENSHGTTATAVSSITGGAGVPTFTSRSTTLFNSNLNRVSIWSAVPTSDYTGTLTMNFSGTTQTGAAWSLVEVQGVNTATANGIVQQNVATGSSGTASVAFSTAPSGATFAAQAHASTAASAPGGNYVEIHDVTAATPAQALQTLYASPGSTSASATFTSAAWGIAVVEVNTTDSAAVIYPTTIDSIVTNTSVTLSVPASASGTVTTSSIVLKISKARLRGWAVL